MKKKQPKLKKLSGQQDSNLRPSAPKADTLTGLRYAPSIAEKEGFEPPVPVTVQRFSRPPHSTTLPSLQNIAMNFD